MSIVKEKKKKKEKKNVNCAPYVILELFLLVISIMLISWEESSSKIRKSELFGCKVWLGDSGEN